MSRIDPRDIRAIDDKKTEAQQCDARTFQAQQALNAWAKMSWLKQDGILGKRTRAALKKFQEENGLSVTGELDHATEEALQAVNRDAQHSSAQSQQQNQDKPKKEPKPQTKSPVLTQSPSVRFSVNGALQSVKDGVIDGAINGVKDRAATVVKQQASEMLDTAQRDLLRYVDGSVRWAESLGVLGSDKQTKIAQQNDDIVNLAIDVAHNPQDVIKSAVKTIVDEAVARAAAGRANGAANTNDAVYELSKKQAEQLTELITGKIVAQMITNKAYKGFIKSARGMVRDTVAPYSAPLKVAQVGIEIQAFLGKMAEGSEALKKSNNSLYRKLDGSALNGAAEYENLHLLYFLVAPYQAQIDIAARAYVASGFHAQAS